MAETIDLFREGVAIDYVMQYGSGWQEPAGHEVVTGDYCSSFFKMPVSCCVFDCTKRFIKGEGMKFYSFPRDPER